MVKIPPTVSNGAISTLGSQTAPNTCGVLGILIFRCQFLSVLQDPSAKHFFSPKKGKKQQQTEIIKIGTNVVASVWVGAHSLIGASQNTLVCQPWCSVLSPLAWAASTHTSSPTYIPQTIYIIVGSWWGAPFHPNTSQAENGRRCFNFLKRWHRRMGMGHKYLFCWGVALQQRSGSPLCLMSTKRSDDNMPTFRNSCKSESGSDCDFRWVPLYSNILYPIFRSIQSP